MILPFKHNIARPCTGVIKLLLRSKITELSPLKGEGSTSFLIILTVYFFIKPLEYDEILSYKNFLDLSYLKYTHSLAQILHTKYMPRLFLSM